MAEGNVIVERKFQSHEPQAAAVITTGATNQSAFLDSFGMAYLSVNLANDAATATTVSVDWSFDGLTVSGNEQVLASASTQLRCATVNVKATYYRVNVTNGDAASHTITTRTYLIP